MKYVSVIGHTMQCIHRKETSSVINIKGKLCNSNNVIYTIFILILKNFTILLLLFYLFSVKLK